MSRYYLLAIVAIVAVCGLVFSEVNNSATGQFAMGGSRKSARQVCLFGFQNCDANLATGIGGCEVDTRVTLSHCGGCNNICGSANGNPVCTAGVCGITCNAGYGNCNGNTADGCEVDTTFNNNNCGICGTVCSSGYSCINSACKQNSYTYPASEYLTFTSAPASNVFTTVSSTTGGFTAGDAVLVVQTSGGNMGVYQIFRVAQIVDATHIKVSGTITQSFSSGVIVKVKEYSSLTLTSGQTIAAGSAGFAAIIVYGTLTINSGASINADYLGNAGAAAFPCGGYCLGCFGYAGSGTGAGGRGTSPAQPRSGCCDKSPYITCNMNIGVGGGGGGYGTAGTAGGGYPGCAYGGSCTNPYGGSAYGANTNVFGNGLMLGSGGGGMLQGGGNGGGALFIRANSIVNGGARISSVGGAGGTGSWGGGGGSGGTVILQTQDSSCSSVLPSVLISGGAAGSYGGTGGQGRSQCITWTTSAFS